MKCLTSMLMPLIRRLNVFVYIITNESISKTYLWSRNIKVKSYKDRRKKREVGLKGLNLRFSKIQIVILVLRLQNV